MYSSKILTFASDRFLRALIIYSSGVCEINYYLKETMDHHFCDAICTTAFVIMGDPWTNPLF